MKWPKRLPVFWKNESNKTLPGTSKKVLIISYYFPPAGGAGVQRVVKLIRHLPRYGWQPVILTVTETADYPVRDNELLQEIPVDVPVYRTGIYEPYEIYRKITGKNASNKLDMTVLATAESHKKTISERLALFIRTWFFIPDARIGWYVPAIKMGQRIIQQEKIDLILSTGPPNTCHLIARTIKRQTGKRWIADFRDPWFKYLVPKRDGFIPRRLDEWLARQVLQSADHIVAVCKGVKRELLSNFSNIARSKIAIITNGFARENFLRIPSPQMTARFKLTYVGSIYLYYDLSALVQAIAQLWQTHVSFRNDFILEIYGRQDDSVVNLLKTTTFTKSIVMHDYLTYFHALQKMVESSVLLLYIIDTEHGKNIPTSKLYEYLGAGRPILALAPADSDAAEIIHLTGAGIIAPPSDVEMIRNSLLELYQRWQQNHAFQLNESNELKLRFEMNTITAEFVRLFNDSSRI